MPAKTRLVNGKFWYIEINHQVESRRYIGRWSKAKVGEIASLRGKS